MIAVFSEYRSFVEKLGYVLLRPEETMLKMHKEEGILEGLFVTFVFTFSLGVLLGSWMAKLLLLLFPSVGIYALSVPVFSGLLLFVAAAVFWAVTSLISHVAAKTLFNGRGSFASVLRLTSYSFVPLFLAVLGLLLLEISGLLLFVSILLFAACFFLMVNLASTAVAVAHEIEYSKALFCVVIAPLTLVCLLLTLILLLGGIA